MLLYRISNDLSLVQVSVATKPYYKFINNLLDTDYFAMSFFAASNGGAVTLNKLKKTSACVVNNWFDFTSVQNRAFIKDFIVKNNGYLLDFTNVENKYYFVMPNGKQCVLCGNAHHGISNKPVFPCINANTRNYKYFAIEVENSGVIIHDIQ